MKGFLTMLFLATGMGMALSSCTIRLNPDGSKDVFIDPVAAQAVTERIIVEINQKSSK
jgi:hypothetical protein